MDVAIQGFRLDVWGYETPTGPGPRANQSTGTPRWMSVSRHLRRSWRKMANPTAAAPQAHDLVPMTIEFTLGFYWDNGKSNGNYFHGLYIEVIFGGSEQSGQLCGGVCRLAGEHAQSCSGGASTGSFSSELCVFPWV